MPRKTVAAAVAAFALAAAGAATAAAVTHQGAASTGTVNLHKTKLGMVLAAKSGKTLYLFMADHNGRSSCYGKCASFWPPLLAKSKPTAGTGIKKSLLGTVKRKNGTKQVTYAGHPLYGFKLDKKAGQIAGQNQDFFGGEWYVLNRSGKAIKKAAPTGTTTSTTTTYPSTTIKY